MRTPARFAFVIAEKLVTLIFSFTENVPRLLFDVSRTVNLFPDTSPCADWHTKVDIPVAESNVSDVIVIATPTLIAYWPDIINGSPDVFATETDVVDGQAVIL